MKFHSKRQALTVNDKQAVWANYWADFYWSYVQYKIRGKVI